MAALDDLIQQIKDPELRDRIQREADCLLKQKKFGLVFEDHLPECTPLYGMPIKRKSQVALKTGEVNDIYIVDKIVGDQAECVHSINHETVTLPVKDLIVVAKFGDPIFPCLKQLDSVCNAPDSNLWHTLIEADNYHALQLLRYLYAGKVDCIYIDPPYNTGAKDWKYNNDYVDGNDSYRHSKWLSMMQKRLTLAKCLLNPENSMLMITIDDIELCTLKILIEEIFKSCSIQIVDMVINPKGKARVGRLSQVDEYLLLVFLGQATTLADASLTECEEIRWPYLRRSDVESARGTKKGGKQQFYPIYVDDKTCQIIKIGDALSPEQSLSEIEFIEGATAVFPIREDGKHMNWGLTGDSLQYALDNGCVRVTKSNNPYQEYNFAYVTMPSIKKMLNGEYTVAGTRIDGTKIIILPSGKESQRTTSWKKTIYDANAYGTKLIGQILLDKRFSFPKSLYSVYDALKIYVGNKPNALIVDFFAGSGTTLHAVNLLNKEDSGSRRCIMVTNNEVSADESNALSDKGFQPGDEEWEKLGIARYVNWPRTKCSIQGVDVNGAPISGEYLTTCKQTVEIDRKIVQISMDGNSMSSDAKKSIIGLLEKSKIPQNALTKNSNYILGEDYTTSILFNLEYMEEWLEALEEQSQVTEIYIVTDKKPIFNQIKARVKETLGTISKEESVKFPMSDGFKANAAFFKLGFLNKDAVARGTQFKEILSTLWMKAGAIGPCPVIDDTPDDMLILPKNRFAVLLDETMFNEFAEQMQASPDIQTIYFITDSEKSFRNMSNQFANTTTYQLYRDYLDNFRINIGR